MPSVFPSFHRPFGRFFLHLTWDLQQAAGAAAGILCQLQPAAVLTGNPAHYRQPEAMMRQFRPAGQCLGRFRR